MNYVVEVVLRRIHRVLIDTEEYEDASDVMRTACRSGMYSYIRLVKKGGGRVVVLKIFSKSQRKANGSTVL